MGVVDVGNVAGIDAFFVERRENGGAGRIVGNTAEKDGFMIVASESSGSIGSTAASAEFDTVDVYFRTKFDLVEKSAAISAEIIVVNEVDVL